ncbi:hypothetical protein BD309DRAFT_218208 [Dichomitus squalens]|nr:hypothetical protein BD309DRAFT_218208 [Dichomitus squalens]
MLSFGVRHLLLMVPAECKAVSGVIGPLFRPSMVQKILLVYCTYAYACYLSYIAPLAPHNPRCHSALGTEHATILGATHIGSYVGYAALTRLSQVPSWIDWTDDHTTCHLTAV